MTQSYKKDYLDHHTVSLATLQVSEYIESLEPFDEWDIYSQATLAMALYPADALHDGSWTEEGELANRLKRHLLKDGMGVPPNSLTSKLKVISDKDYPAFLVRAKRVREELFYVTKTLSLAPLLSDGA